MNSTLASLTLLGASLVLAPCSLAGIEYTVTQLSPSGTANNGANGVSANGFVTGRSSDRGFLRSGSAFTDIGLVPDYSTASTGYAVNASGQVAGYGWGGAKGTVAAVYSSGAWKNLGTLGGTTGAANDINDAGLIVGNSTLASGESRGFIYLNGTMQQLAPLAGNSSFAQAVNASGQIAGHTTYGNTAATHAAIYKGTPGMGGSWTDIGSLGGSAFSADINAAGQVVGKSSLATGMASHAFLYANGAMKDLGSLPGSFDGNSEATAINDSGLVVGYCFMPTNNRAFLYANGTMRDLNDLIDSSSGWLITEAQDINNSGLIVGTGIRNGETHAILLTPVTPAVKVQGRQRFSTKRAKLTIRGTASGQVTAVKWTMNKRTRSATGTSSWVFQARLKKGQKNRIAIAAHGPGSVSTAATLVITRR